MKEAKDLVLYEVKGKTAIITLNSPKNYNAMGGPAYWRLNELMQVAADDPNTVVTLIQSTGKFFSSGADVKGKGTMPIADIPDDVTDEEAYYYNQIHWQKETGSRNHQLGYNFIHHPKVLVVALNGPVIGLSAALVLLSDFIYGLDSSYVLLPFANLGLVSEGTSAYTAINRLGWGLGSRALLASQPIRSHELERANFYSELYPQSKFASTEEFNAHVQKTIEDTFYHLHPLSLKGIKELIRKSQVQQLTATSHDEVIGLVKMFTNGFPQEQFMQMATKAKRHKL